MIYYIISYDRKISYLKGPLFIIIIALKLSDLEKPQILSQISTNYLICDTI